MAVMRFRLANNGVPVITTERLILRGHRVEDFVDCLSLWSDPQVTRFIGGRPFTADEVWTRILRYAGRWTLMGFGYWRVEDRASGQCLGEVGYHYNNRDMEPRLDEVPEAGWAFHPHAQGKGYGLEAVQALLAWGDEHFPYKASVCLIDPANQPSIRLAERCGYRLRQRGTFKGEPTLIFDREG